MIEDAASTPSAGDPARPSDASSAAGEKTRATLVRVALDLFGRKGFDATSTRDIAGAAGVNIAGIAYHFGGKAGLHRACGELVAARLAERLVALAPGEPERDAALSPDEAAAVFEASLVGLARFMLAQPEAEAIARFMVREQMDPSPTFDVLYERLIEPRHRRLCVLWARAVGAGAPESEAVVVAVSAIFGQVMFFRVGRATALRRLGWETIDETNVETIVSTVRDNVRAIIAAERSGRATK